MLAIADAYGLRFHYPEGDNCIGPSLRDFGQFARAEIDVLLACADLTEPGWFVDVGGNIGAFALPFANERPAWSVLTIEAQRQLSAVLGANAVLNGLAHVQVMNAAVGAERGVVEFPTIPLSAKGNFGIVRFGLQAPTEPVRMTTLDEAAPPNTRLVKMDIEGYEAEALRGARRLINETRPAWFFEISLEREGVARECIEVFLKAGYSLFWFFGPPVLPGALPDLSKFDSRRGDLNVLALPAGELPWRLAPIVSADAPWPNYREGLAYLWRYLPV